jgi:hypothetical protein
MYCSRQAVVTAIACLNLEENGETDHRIHTRHIINAGQKEYDATKSLGFKVN